jgi:hypothetical protein
MRKPFYHLEDGYVLINWAWFTMELIAGPATPPLAQTSNNSSPCFWASALQPPSHLTALVSRRGKDLNVADAEVLQTSGRRGDA